MLPPVIRYPFFNGIADGHRLPVTLMEATGEPPQETIVTSTAFGIHDLYRFVPRLGAYHHVAEVMV